MKNHTCTRLAALLLAAAAAFSSGSCVQQEEPLTAQSLDGAVAEDWMALMLKFTQRTPGFSPPVAARMFGYIGVGLYQSVQPGMPGYRSLEGRIQGLAPGGMPDAEPGAAYHWGLSANACLAMLVRDCYRNAPAELLASADALEQEYADRFGMETSPEVYERSIAFGQAVASAVIEYANSDGQARCYERNFPEGYTPPAGSGKWIPTPPNFQRALQPYWGSVRPFLHANVTSTQPAPPPAYSEQPNSVFYAQALEVYAVVKSATPAQRATAQYWSDDPGVTATPPGHSVSILRQVLTAENADLGRAAEAFARLGMGLHDAFISCWKTKYETNLIRPVSYIQSRIDPSFMPVLPTPPFPEYTSGHSVQSGAAAQILTDLFGNDYQFADRTHAERTDIDGTPRVYGSFYEFADEAAISRLYGGIHYRAAIEEGVAQGKAIGRNISAIRLRD
ncbi:MAG: vanadium-dependent haloperoxidase [Bacteroidia bacterium]|nr:vanadium-dependent haloperoxidase [Bacteroidia bacterium]